MASFLTNLTVDEVSMVDEGANPDADIVLYKRKGTEMKPEEIQKALEAAEAENKVLKAVDALDNDQRAFYKSLSSAEDKTAFLNGDADFRKSKMGDTFKKSLSGDEAEEVQKQLTTVQKERDEAKAEITKRDETIAKRDEEIVKLKGKVEDADLRAEVLKTYPNTKGTVEEKVAVLKAVKAQPDEAVRKSMLDTMAQAEAAATSLTKEKGSSGGDGEGKEAKDKLDNLAKSIVEKAKGNGENLTFEQGFAKALDTDEGKKLYQEIRNQ